ncbi:hypothetical protein TI04_04085 [Achromatium sp. WMS2]|nr:hypothetical protein TI04_04085 [Achromatium sp. WMS2]
MLTEDLSSIVTNALDDLKAKNLQIIDVRGKTSITDLMIIASGTSDTHVKAMATEVQTQAKAAGSTVLGIEGMQGGEWALIDLNDVVVHIMLPRVRDYYQLEKLWGVSSPPAEA